VVGPLGQTSVTSRVWSGMPRGEPMLLQALVFTPDGRLVTSEPSMGVVR